MSANPILKNRLFTATSNNVVAKKKPDWLNSSIKQTPATASKNPKNNRTATFEELCQSEAIASILGLTIPNKPGVHKSNENPISVREWFKRIGLQNEQNILQFFPYKLELSIEQEQIARLVCSDIVAFDENTLRGLNNTSTLYFRYETDAIMVKLSVF
ncbi:MAG: hypothetical protein HC836_25720 [Richelia sp. RM2_1_2]|nr:hypothetical protein [Richelia sp. RM2_1_2]